MMNKRVRQVLAILAITQIGVTACRTKSIAQNPQSEVTTSAIGTTSAPETSTGKSDTTTAEAATGTETATEATGTSGEETNGGDEPGKEDPSGEDSDQETTTTSSESSEPDTKESSTAKPEPKDLTNLSNKGSQWSHEDAKNGNLDWVKKYDGVWEIGEKDLYLTLDLGYSTGYEEKILDTLKDKGVKVVFFVTTEYLKEKPDLIERMEREGHVIGNHSTGHKNMMDLVGTDGVDLNNNMNSWEDAYENITGHSYKEMLYRAPEGALSERGMKAIQDLGYQSVFWASAYNDWDDKKQPSLDEMRNRLYKYIDGGEVILLHPFKTNADNMATFIDEMRAKGHDFALIP